MASSGCVLHSAPEPATGARATLPATALGVTPGGMAARRIAALWFVVVLAAIALPGAADAQAQKALPCADGAKECAARALHGHVVYTQGYWQSAMGRPVEQRIAAAPAELVEYLNLDNVINDIAARPRAARPSAGFLRDIRRALAEMPDAVRRLLAPKLAGIYLVENLGGTGYTDVVYDADSRPAGGYVVLDAAALKKRAANAWATWKENTPFTSRPGFRLTAQIETRAHDNRRNAIQYILLHELAHVLSIGERLHPPWGVEPKDVQSPDDYPFFLLSWRIDRAENRYVTLFDAAFPQRKDVVYYFGAKLDAGEMAATYDNLERTNFATLYAATRPGDDFAEAFASYVHTVLMNKPFAIRIYRGGRLVKTFAACWGAPRCAEKRDLLEKFLAVAH